MSTEESSDKQTEANGVLHVDLIRVRIDDKYSVRPSNQPICTRCCYTMTTVIQICSNCFCGRVFVINTHLDEIICPRNSRMSLQKQALREREGFYQHAYSYVTILLKTAALRRKLYEVSAQHMLQNRLRQTPLGP